MDRTWRVPIATALVGIVGFLAAACHSPGTPSDRGGPPERADIIDALFFGRGPLAHVDRDCPIPDRWAAYASPSTVAVVLARTIDSPGEQTLARLIVEIQQASNDRLRFTLERSVLSDPTLTAGQITSADVPDAVIRATCSPGGSGCTRVLVSADGLLTGARCIQREGTSARLKAHEFGHAIGLCHIDATRIPDALMSPSPGVLSQDRFSAPELDAIRAVYASAVQPGATREDFQKAGLVRRD